MSDEGPSGGEDGASACGRGPLVLRVVLGGVAVLMTVMAGAMLAVGVDVGKSERFGFLVLALVFAAVSIALWAGLGLKLWKREE